MTDPCGRAFISYRRERAVEVADLGRRLRARGIPLWVDVSDLGPGSTEKQIIEALEDEGCACGIVWLTPEVADSAVIRRIEVPRMVRRAGRHDGFFAAMAIAGGLEYAEATHVAAENLGTEELKFWNLQRVDSDPASAAELARFADAVLRQRIAAVAATLTASEQWRLGIWARRQPPLDRHYSLQLDWHDSFAGRQAEVGAWEADLIPALKSVRAEITRSGVDRGVVAEGHPTMATAVVFGRAFPAVAGIRVGWEQVGPGGNRDVWSLAAPPEPSGYTIKTRGIDPKGDGLAVLLSVGHDASVAYGASQGLPAMRATVEVSSAGASTGEHLSAGAACQLAHEIADGVRRARTAHLGVRTIHLFLACPVGLAMMVGQLLNAVGPVSVYEHIDDDGVGHYVPEVLIPGSGFI